MSGHILPSIRARDPPEASPYSSRMPARIRVQRDRITADLAAHRLREEGIPAEVVSDDDRLLGGTGIPMFFSLVVPSQHEERARKILAEVEGPTPKRR